MLRIVEDIGPKSWVAGINVQLGWIRGKKNRIGVQARIAHFGAKSALWSGKEAVMHLTWTTLMVHFVVADEVSGVLITTGNSWATARVKLVDDGTTLILWADFDLASILGIVTCFQDVGSFTGFGSLTRTLKTLLVVVVVALNWDAGAQVLNLIVHGRVGSTSG